ncbi:hypothetical protein SCHIN_v1c00700 [Spiroplasma chinense]|uniref:Uncharacterized protein n=1 Tax=Spiroplasma chinense TaxID=216932 RepID=A0A5B9Y2G2_9MOLU|nr:hypothetical protein [Spiroplasma chinense]QEH61268.1 hypothetical protein SCHIN_v1c00700 [Spiroplasma chinense]
MDFELGTYLYVVAGFTSNLFFFSYLHHLNEDYKKKKLSTTIFIFDDILDPKTFPYLLPIERKTHFIDHYIKISIIIMTYIPIVLFAPRDSKWYLFFLLLISLMQVIFLVEAIIYILYIKKRVSKYKFFSKEESIINFKKSILEMEKHHECMTFIFTKEKKNKKAISRIKKAQLKMGKELLLLGKENQDYKVLKIFLKYIKKISWGTLLFKDTKGLEIICKDNTYPYSELPRIAIENFLLVLEEAVKT